MSSISRLEKTFFRLQAQHACLGFAFEDIGGRDGVVLELGLGHGRTFDHLRRHLPERDIFVFDRANDAYLDCQPDPALLILGEIAETFPANASRFSGRVLLANSDIGSFDKTWNREAAQLSSRLLPPVMAPGGLIMSDLPLQLPDFEVLPLPAGAREGRYYLYRAPS